MLSTFSATVSHAQQPETPQTPAQPNIAAQHQIAGLAPKDSGIVALPDAPVASPSPVSSQGTNAGFDRASFFLLSAGVYNAAFLDMYETQSMGSHVHEYDPLARPFVHLPAPAYYATGAALATGVNWLGWKLAHSRRWRHIWWVPQLSTIAANSSGFGYTITHK